MGSFRRTAPGSFFLKELAVDGLFEQIGEQKRFLQVLPNRHGTVTLDDYDGTVLEFFDDLLGSCNRRCILRDNRHFADGILLFKTDWNKALARQGKCQHHRRVNMDKGLRVLVLLYGKMEPGL